MLPDFLKLSVPCFLRDKRGQFAVMTAIMTPVALTFAALAVDTGSFYLEKRRLQSLADLSAIVAAANLAKPDEAVRITLTENRVMEPAIGVRNKEGIVKWKPHPNLADAGFSAIVTLGRYQGSSTIDPTDRFTSSVAHRQANAAQVVLRTTGTRYFSGLLIPPPQISVQATASSSAYATFSVGSRLLNLKDGVVNSLLSGLTDSNISLSVMDYNALLGADISLLSFLDALATELNLTVADYDALLDAQANLGQVGRAIAATDGVVGNLLAAATKLGRQGGGINTPKFPISRLIGIAPELPRVTIDRVGGDVRVMELIMMSAVLAGQGRQVGLDLGASIPGLLSISVDLAIGEPQQALPWFAIGSGGEVVRTSQTRLRIIAEIANHNLLTTLLGARLRIPLYLELAYAEAKLNAISCPPGRPDNVNVKIDARPGVANLYLAEVDPLKIVNFANPAPRSPAKLVTLPLVNVSGQAQVEIGSTSYKTLTFNASDIRNKKVKQVSTKSITTSPVQSLFSGLQLEVKVDRLLGLPVISLPSNLTNLLGQTLGTATPALDGILNTILELLGISIGQADIAVYEFPTCNAAVLVQ